MVTSCFTAEQTLTHDCESPQAYWEIQTGNGEKNDVVFVWFDEVYTPKHMQTNSPKATSVLI